MRPRVQITHIEDTRKLVDSWIAVGAHVVKINEDTEDGILWMTLKSRLGCLQLRRDSHTLSLDAPTNGVWATLTDVPGSPYVVEDNCWGRENPEEVRAEHDRLWRRYFNPDWKRLDFLLAGRKHSAEPSLATMLMWVCVVPTAIGLGLVIAVVLLTWFVK